MDFHLFSIIVDFFHIYFFFQSHLNPILIRSLFSGRFSIDLSETCLCMLFFYYNILLFVCVHVFLQQKIHVCKNDKHRTGLVVDNRLIQKTNRRSGFQSKCQQYILFLSFSHSLNHAFINGIRKNAGNRRELNKIGGFHIKYDKLEKCHQFVEYLKSSVVPAL